jgi:hypothetical protein
VIPPTLDYSILTSTTGIDTYYTDHIMLPFINCHHVSNIVCASSEMKRGSRPHFNIIALITNLPSLLLYGWFLDVRKTPPLIIILLVSLIPRRLKRVPSIHQETLDTRTRWGIILNPVKHGWMHYCPTTWLKLLAASYWVLYCSQADGMETFESVMMSGMYVSPALLQKWCSMQKCFFLDNRRYTKCVCGLLARRNGQ